MKTKLLLFVLLFSLLAEAQITKAEAFTTGTKLAFYPNQCGNTIPEASGKLTFCDGIDNLGIVERSYGLNDRRVERMLPNHFNEDEVFVTGKGLSIRNEDGTWENIPNIAIPTFNGQGDWTNAATIRNGLVLPDGKVLIQSSTNLGPIIHIYERILKTFTNAGFPNNRFPQLMAYDSDRDLTWIIAFNSSDRYLYSFDGTTVSFVANLPTLQSVSVSVSLANLIYNDDYLYLGGINGLHKIDLSNYMSPPLAVVSYDSTSTPALPFDVVTDFQFDINNDLWLSQRTNGGGGIVKFDIDNETYELYELERENNTTLNHSFEALAIDNMGVIWTAASTSSSLYKLTFPSDIETWNTTTDADLETFGVPITYEPSEVYFRNNQFYFTTVDFSSGSNNNFEVIINNNDAWSGRNDNAPGNLSQRMTNRFTGSMPDSNGGVWWFNGNDDIIVYRDSDDNHQSILLDNMAFFGVVDVDDKAVLRGGSPNELRKIDFPNAISIQDGVNQATDMKRVADQIWVFDHTNKKIDAYKNDALVNTYNLDEDWYQLVYDFAVDDDGNAWFMRNGSGSLIIKKFDTTTLTTTTYDAEVPDVSLSTLRKVVAAPNGGVWFMGTLGVVYQENDVFYDFIVADYPEIYNLRDLIVDINGKAYLLNNDNASITSIENPTDVSPIIENIDIESNNSVLPSLDHYRPDAIAIDSEGSIWTHASLNTFKFIDADLATEYIVQPTLSVTSNEFTSKINIHPNPTNGIVNINSKYQIDAIEIYSVIGNRVAIFNNTSQIDLSKITSGLYILKITSQGKITSKKIVLK